MDEISKKLAEAFLKWKAFHSIILFTALGFTFSATQFFGISRDYLNYSEIFDQVRSFGFNVLFTTRIEPGFIALSIILSKLFPINIVVYSLVVAFCLLLKGWVISSKAADAKIFLLVSIFYLFRFFPLHELTQLRIALAISLILVGSTFVWNGRIYSGAFICIAALLFHVSAAIVIPALYIYSPKRWKILLAVLFFFTSSVFLTELSTEYLSGYLTVLRDYEANLQFGDIKPNIFAPYILIDIMMIIISIANWNKLTILMKRVIFLEVIGFSIFFGAIEFGVIAIRLREIFSVFWIFYLVDGFKQKGMRLYTYTFAIINSVLYSYLFFIYQKIPFFLNYN